MTTQPTIFGRVPGWTQGDYLRKARMSAGMTTKDLAEATGISEKTINNYENERVTPRRPAIIAWAFATGVDLEWLSMRSVPEVEDGPDDPGGNSVTGEYCGYGRKVFANLQRVRETGSRLVLPLRKVDPAAAAA